MDNPIVSSRPMPGTPYREHTVSLGGVELRTQMHPFSPEEIHEAVTLYLQYGICTPRHQCSRWGDQYSAPRQQLPDGGRVIDRIVYEGLPMED